MDAVRLKPHHSRNHTQASDYASDHQSSDDGYDYNIVDDAPEAEPTKPKELARATPHQAPPEASASRRPDVADDAFTETMPYIFQRHAGGRRAKIPTDVDVDLEMGLNSASARDKKKTWRAISELKNIKLRWTMPEIKNRRVLQLDFDKADAEAQEHYLQRRRVRWQ